MHKFQIGDRAERARYLASGPVKGHVLNQFAMDELGDHIRMGEFAKALTFSGLIVYDVSVKEGLHERGRVAHPATTQPKPSVTCSNWWSSATSDVKRSIFMDDHVYSIATDIMRIQQLDAMGQDVASVPWP